ncbi:WW domain-containing protein [Blastomyces gilchristii SLH14081]|uniref:WW domain-containing protein n=1 Tax=Blastomyces gilchristii (strain SLH14081) TaxID=559298 RepID=A0A179UCA6_BLAGS|nr:WW domain-containing protein [Blastomyces gilchristii SLH14081]OAT04797.1 WW domain-containing protein [Blastomyces gilchristii SLH14081]
MASNAASVAVGDRELLARVEDVPQPEIASPKTPRDWSRKDAEQKDVLGDEDNKDDKEPGEELEEGQEEEAKEADGEEPHNSAPPLPQEDLPPPLPNEVPPGQTEDDGWDPVWDDSAQAYYFYNRFTGLSQWENPRVPDTHQQTQQADASQSSQQQQSIKPRVAGGYDPAIHGDYDPTAPYAQVTQQQQQEGLDAAGAAYSSDPNYIYTATGTFNRFTGKWQPGALAKEYFDDENKSKRQLNAYFDVDAAANSHDGKSLKAERSGKKLTKKELKAFKEKRRERKEEKRRAWLRD